MSELHDTLCRDKYAILPDLLSDMQMDLLLQGRPRYQKQVSKRRAVTKEWPGSRNLSDVDLRYFRFVKLPDGRVDINLPSSLIEVCGIRETIEERVLSDLPSGFQIPHWNLLINPHNPNMQNWHQDNGGLEADSYYTLLIPLNYQEGMGLTEVIVPYSEDTSPFTKTGRNLRPGFDVLTPGVDPGDALLFSGCLWHRGTPNLSADTRYCLYAIITRVPEETFEGW